MQDLQLILLGVALGAVPTAMLGRIMAVSLAKWAGIEPKEIESYTEATDGSGGEE